MKIRNKILLSSIIALVLFGGVVLAANEEIVSVSIPKETKPPMFLPVFFLFILTSLITLLFIFRKKAVLIGAITGGFIGLSWTTILGWLGHYIKVPTSTDVAPSGHVYLSYYFNCSGANAWGCGFFTVISIPFGILLGLLIGYIIKKKFKNGK